MCLIHACCQVCRVMLYYNAIFKLCAPYLVMCNLQSEVPDSHPDQGGQGGEMGSRPLHRRRTGAEKRLGEGEGMCVVTHSQLWASPRRAYIGFTTQCCITKSLLLTSIPLSLYLSLSFSLSLTHTLTHRFLCSPPGC